MESLVARTEAWIVGTTNAWSVTSADDEHGRPVAVALEIQGDASAGYHLVKSPDGFFTADDWFLTRDEALNAALEIFGVEADAWAVCHDEHS